MSSNFLLKGFLWEEYQEFELWSVWGGDVDRTITFLGFHFLATVMFGLLFPLGRRFWEVSRPKISPKRFLNPRSICASVHALCNMYLCVRAAKLLLTD